MSKLAYSKAEAAAACGVSEKTIQRAISDGDLPATYPTSHPVILAEDLRAWLASKPTERPAKKAS